MLDLNACIKLLLQGKLVILPTETVYGLFFLEAFFEKNLKLVLQIKNRKKEQFCKYLNISKKIPGLTIIYKQQGYRISNNPILQEIINRVGILYGTSANLSGHYPITHHKHNQLDVPILEAGFCEIGIESTVYDYDNDILIRQGPIFFKEGNIKKYKYSNIEYTDQAIDISKIWYLVNENQTLYLPKNPSTYLENLMCKTFS